MKSLKWCNFVCKFYYDWKNNLYHLFDQRQLSM